MLTEFIKRVAPENLESLDIPALENLNREFAEHQTVLRNCRIDINKEVLKRMHKEAAKRAIENKSDEEKAALLQELTGDKVDTQEDVKGSA